MIDNLLQNLSPSLDLPMALPFQPLYLPLQLPITTWTSGPLVLINPMLALTVRTKEVLQEIGTDPHLVNRNYP